jgi:hypothetical protein
MDKVYAFLYNDCIHESSYATMSLHRTPEGAEKAMNEHKEKERLNFENGYKKRLTEEWQNDPDLDEEAKKVLIDSIGNFDAHKDWAVEEMEVLE